jgi:hypothetical protein
MWHYLSNSSSEMPAPIFTTLDDIHWWKDFYITIAEELSSRNTVRQECVCSIHISYIATIVSALVTQAFATLVFTARIITEYEV